MYRIGTIRGRLALATALLVLVASARAGVEPATQYSQSTTKSFDDVMFDLQIAITGHNFRITGQNKIGEAIAKRHDIDFPKVTVTAFCNLEFARKLLQASPDYITYMPCSIAVSERHDRVIIVTHLLPKVQGRLHEITEHINTILKDMVQAAAR